MNLNHKETFGDDPVNEQEPKTFNDDNNLEIDDYCNESTSLIQITPVRKNGDVTDRYYFVFIIAIIKGMGVILPWHIFMTSKSYFIDFKLAPAGSADYRLNFLSYAGLSAQIPNAVLNFTNLFTEGSGKGNTNTRIVVSILSLSGLFLITTIFATLDTSDYVFGFFILTLATVVLVNVFTGVWSNCVFGIFAQFPAIYINAIMTGMQVAGFISTSLMLITKAAATPRTGGIIYFMGSACVCLICLDFFLALPISRYYRNMYSERDAAKENRISSYERLPYMKTLKTSWYQLFDLWILRVVALCVYPAILVDVRKSDPHFFVSDGFYTDSTYIVYNIFNLIGNLFSYKWRKPSSKYIGIRLWLWVLSVPFFLMCNYRPETRGNVPVWFNDWVFFLGIVVFGLGNGHVSGLTVMYAKESVGCDRLMQKTVGMMSAFAQSIGFVCAHLLTLLLSYIIENV